MCSDRGTLTLSWEEGSRPLPRVHFPLTIFPPKSSFLYRTLIPEALLSTVVSRFLSIFCWHCCSIPTNDSSMQQQQEKKASDGYVASYIAKLYWSDFLNFYTMRSATVDDASIDLFLVFSISMKSAAAYEDAWTTFWYFLSPWGLLQ